MIYHSLALSSIKNMQLALEVLEKRFSDQEFSIRFQEILATLESSKNKIVVTGVGKSSLAARKLASMFSSTGSPSYFLDPVSASHGDMGSLTYGDVLVIISWSGRSGEMSNLAEYAYRKNIPTILVTNRTGLSAYASHILKLPDIHETVGKIPSISYLLTSLVCDILSFRLMEMKGIDKDFFLSVHPGGAIGDERNREDETMQSGERPIDGLLWDFMSGY